MAEQIIRAAQSELREHYFGTFVDNPPSIAHGGNGVVVPGCVPCKLRLNTHGQFLDHLSNDVLPGIIERVLAAT
jgi:hypothetical protein